MRKFLIILSLLVLAGCDIKQPPSDPQSQLNAYISKLAMVEPKWIYTNTVKCVSYQMQGYAELDDGAELRVPWEVPENTTLLMAYSVETGPVLIDPTGKRTPFANKHPIDLIFSKGDRFDADNASIDAGMVSETELWNKEIERIYTRLELVLPKRDVENSRKAWKKSLETHTALAGGCYDYNGTQSAIDYSGAILSLTREHALTLNQYLIQRLWGINSVAPIPSADQKR
jgi:hypothetical protein